MATATKTKPKKAAAKKTKKTAKQLPVHLYILIDRSGSMSSLREAVVSGFTQFVDDQKSKPGECKLTVVQFDDVSPQEYLYKGIDLQDVKGLDQYLPRGMTPLWDAQGQLITAAEKKAKKDEAILFVTITDGLENSSKEWTAERLGSKKAELEKKGWIFTDLALGHAVVHHAQSQVGGTVPTAAIANAPTTVGVANSVTALSYATDNVRSSAIGGMHVNSSKLYAGASTSFANRAKVDDKDAKEVKKRMAAYNKGGGKPKGK